MYSVTVAGPKKLLLHFETFVLMLRYHHSVAAQGDEEGARGQAEAPPPGGLQRRGGPHRHFRR